MRAHKQGADDSPWPVLRSIKTDNGCMKVSFVCYNKFMGGVKRDKYLVNGNNWCNLCEKIKPIDEFVKDKRLASGVRGRCKDCVRTMSKKLADANRSAVRLANRKSYIQKKYKISLEEYENLLVLQNYSCAICAEEIDLYANNCKGKKNEAHLDHDHKTGKIRAFLCYRCNVGLGLFRDNTSLLEKAFAYLSEHKTRR